MTESTRGILRAAILGCGKIAGLNDAPRTHGKIATHAQAYHRHPDFELIGVADSDSTRLSLFADQWGVDNSYKDVNDLLDSCAPDILSICSSTSNHFGNLITTLARVEVPSVVFIEKPLCQKKDELEKLEQAIIGRENLVQVNHTRRFDPEHIRIGEDIRAGKFGNLIEGLCRYYGGWLNNGPHLVDTLRMLLDDEPQVISVTPGAEGRENDPCWDVETKILGAPVWLESFDEVAYQLFEIDLFFTRGRILFRDFGETIIVEHQIVNSNGERVLSQVTDSPRNGLVAPLFNAMELFSLARRGEVNLANSGTNIQSAGKTMEILWQVTKNAEKR